MSGPKNLDIVPDVYSISEYTDVGYFRLGYQGVFPDIGDDISPAALPAPACRRTGPEATVQALHLVQPLGPHLCRPMGQCLGYCLHPCAQRATAENGPGLGWSQHHSTRNLKLGIIEFQVATFVTVAAGT